MRFKNVPYQKAIKVLRFSDQLFTEVIECNRIWYNSLELAISNSHPVYDTLFVASAIYKKTKLVTFDLKLLNKFPSETISVDNYLLS